MPYTVDYSQSSKTAIIVNDGTIDTSTSLGLIGKNYTRFGETLNENLLHLLENLINQKGMTYTLSRLIKYWKNTKNGKHYQ